MNMAQNPGVFVQLTSTLRSAEPPFGDLTRFIDGSSLFRVFSTGRFRALVLILGGATSGTLVVRLHTRVYRISTHSSQVLQKHNELGSAFDVHQFRN